jgi:hypothetical protein
MRLVVAAMLAACGSAPEPVATAPAVNVPGLVAGATTQEGKAALLAGARTLHDSGAPKDCVAAYQAYLKVDDENPSANAFLGSCLTKMAITADNDVKRVEWVKKGFQQMDDTAARFPDAYDVYLVRGINAVHIPVMFERYNTGVRDFAKLEAMHAEKPGSVPDSVMPMVLWHHAVALQLAGKTAEAQAMRKRLSTEHPGSEFVSKSFDFDAVR